MASSEVLWLVFMGSTKFATKGGDKVLWFWRTWRFDQWQLDGGAHIQHGRDGFVDWAGLEFLDGGVFRREAGSGVSRDVTASALDVRGPADAVV